MLQIPRSAPQTHHSNSALTPLSQRINTGAVPHLVERRLTLANCADHLYSKQRIPSRHGIIQFESSGKAYFNPWRPGAIVPVPQRRT
ncbi:hypothetical protein Hypma_012091 [Hypsizygus marmoreus]|uniref:Uncharacterized protein n=1 Tax=Hypsizygus marmoreus TaxID=39966 RepID=A0A369JML1_HYPMA|nr:hypothetical protein Hypma_012091 [Hypsizygus marmoreus]